MNRRSFFTTLGAAAATPLISCVGRDGRGPTSQAPDEGMVEFRAFPLPSIDPALPFAPLRRVPRR